ncbi:hypothetical protein [Streptomyces sp. WMMC897]|uniref:hypothetical protein n=1 Tax=Streptomyces sp. WMMC897 TaxID=3014782 RepID=UPI0022B71191|nr:hypothetical protein [Streptomyces sp. WMMC897]MCZ7416210.1 hypothetical protein [Streptomyces sp. WMMC897]
MLGAGTAGLAALGTLGASVALSGCSGGRERELEQRRADERDARLRGAAARDSAALLRRYDATAGAHPALAGRLAPLRADVALHLTAFGAAGGTDGASASRSPDAAATGPGSGASGDATVPEGAREALAELAAAERSIARARVGALADARPELARLLASVAAAGEVHAYLLGERSAGGS